MNAKGGWGLNQQARMWTNNSDRIAHHLSALLADCVVAAWAGFFSFGSNHANGFESVRVHRAPSRQPGGLRGVVTQSRKRPNRNSFFFLCQLRSRPPPTSGFRASVFFSIFNASEARYYSSD